MNRAAPHVPNLSCAPTWLGKDLESHFDTTPWHSATNKSHQSGEGYHSSVYKRDVGSDRELPTFCGDNKNQQSRKTSKTSLFKAAPDFSVRGEISQGRLGYGWNHGKTIKQHKRHTTISLL